MRVPAIEATGVTVSESTTPGYFRVTVWSRTRGDVRMADDTYDHLTWDEALDTMGAELECRRPGFQYVDGGWQPSLFSAAE